jgi:hypothetical protein
VYGLLDLEIARQRREELLREADEGRRARAAGWATETSGKRRAFARRILSSVRPGASAGVATTKMAGAPVCGCSADRPK